MGDKGESVYSPVEPFSGVGVGDGSREGAIGASNGVVTLSKSIGAQDGGVKMQMLRITQCRDSLMWYAAMVGDLVPYCGRWREAYKSLEPAGYLNRVEFADAEIVELLPDGSIVPV